MGIEQINQVTSDMQKVGEESSTCADQLSQAADRLGVYVGVNQEVVGELARLIGIRKRVRYQCADSADLYGRINGRPCKILDISVQGARVESDIAVQGKQVEFECGVNGKSFRLSAGVVWKRGKRMGLEFMSTPGQDLILLIDTHIKSDGTAADTWNA